MPVEALLILLPLAVLSGWWIGRRRISGVDDDTSGDFSSRYFQGLNYLLNEQPDKAIEVFVKMIEVDKDTVETHFTLGNLFRKRGEVDRAIRVHQNLIARTSLTVQHREQALYELGLDYMGAGILGRAEALFLELIETESEKVQALKQLLDIYQQERDWEKGVAILQKYESATGKSQKPIIAHFYCELAEEAKHKGDEALVRSSLKEALSYDKNCVRACLLEGEIEMTSGQYEAAMQAYKNVELQDPDYLPEIIAPLLICAEKLGKEVELIQYFREVLDRHDGISVMLALADLIKTQHGDEEAITFIVEQLRKRPSVRGLNHLIELSLISTEGSAKDNLLLLMDLTTTLLENKAVYKCHQCGFKGKSMHWLCPGCNRWNSIKPIQGVEGE